MEQQKVVVNVSDSVSGGGVIKNVNGQVCVWLDRKLDFTIDESEMIDVQPYGITPEVLRNWYENRYPLVINGNIMTVMHVRREYNDFGETNLVCVFVAASSDVAECTKPKGAGVITMASLGDEIAVATITEF